MNGPNRDFNKELSVTVLMFNSFDKLKSNQSEKSYFPFVGSYVFHMGSTSPNQSLAQ